MSVFLMIGAAAVAEGTSETVKNIYDKVKDFAASKLLQHQQRAARKRRERREFI